MTVGGRSRYAHRMAYEAFREPIPPGMQIDHLCRNPRCVNPDHMEVVTLVENVMRGNSPAAKIARRDCCPKGHRYTPETTIIRTDGYRRCAVCYKKSLRSARLTA